LALAGWCSECKQYVWIRSDGDCASGHPASCISNTYEADPLAQSGGSQSDSTVTTSHVLTASTHYEVLQVGPGAADADIKSAYKRLAKATHPDANPRDPLAHAKFIRVQEAYEVLSDPVRRASYDRLQARLAGSTAYWSPQITVTSASPCRTTATWFHSM